MSKGKIYAMDVSNLTVLSTSIIFANPKLKNIGLSKLVQLVLMTRSSISSSGKQPTKIRQNEEGGERQKINHLC